MNLSVSNINAQLAFFRKEMTTSDEFIKAWNDICKAKTARKASDIFLEYIEKPKIKNYDTRRNYAVIIYNRMKKF